MKRVVTQLKKFITNIDKKEDIVTAECVFPGDFIVFGGHFPSNPIVPGICKVQLVKVLMESIYNKKFNIEEILLAKFYAPVLPEMKIFIESKVEQTVEGKIHIKSLFTVENKKVAQVELLGKI